jgi:hypothetical protein
MKRASAKKPSKPRRTVAKLRDAEEALSQGRHTPVEYLAKFAVSASRRLVQRMKATGTHKKVASIIIFKTS